MFDLEITDYIDEYQVYRLRQTLNTMRDAEVRVLVDSLGGSVAAGITMFRLIKNHGKVTVQINGFTASAATILTLGAAKIEMSAYALYLMHKCSVFISHWGSMNSTEINETIDSLEKNQYNLEKVDELVSSMYADRSNQPKDMIQDILGKDTWMNAEEALALGLVDEIVETENKPELTNEFKDKFVAYGYSIPVNVPEHKPQASNLLQTLINSGREYFSAAKPNPEPAVKDIILVNMSDYKKINATLGVDGIAVADGVASFTESQIQAIENELKRIDQFLADAASLNDRIDALNAENVELKNKPGDTTISVNRAEGKEESNNPYKKVSEFMNFFNRK